MTPLLWLYLYVFAVLILAAIFYGWSTGDSLYWADIREERLKRHAIYAALQREEEQERAAELAERRKLHFRNINRLSALAAARGRISDSVGRTGGV